MKAAPRRTATALTSRETVREDGFPYSPSDRFWADFHHTYWEKRGCVLQKLLPRPLATPAEAFAWVAKACARYNAGDRSVPVHFYVDQARVLADIEKHLPKMGEETVGAYAARLHRELNIQRFGLLLDDIQTDEELWPRLRDFLHGLLELTGIPWEVNAMVFLGNYARTAFGIHKGLSTNFMFVVEGRKRIRAWPDSFFQSKLKFANSQEYDQLLGDAITLEGGPGDVLYWPSDYRHIGEDAGGLSMAISLQISMRHRLPAQALRVAASRVEGLWPGFSFSEAFSLSARPRETRAAVQRVVKLGAKVLEGAARDPELHEAFTAWLLQHITGMGSFSVPPPLPENPLALDDMVRRDPATPILYVPTRKREFLCAANGHSFALAAHPSIPRLIDRLNSGEPARVKQLVEDYAGTATRGGVRMKISSRDLRGLLARLASIRAIHVTAAPSSAKKKTLRGNRRTTHQQDFDVVLR